VKEARGRNDLPHGWCQKFSNSFKSIHNLVLLDLKLMIIADVLILTASAMGEIAAEGLFSVRRKNG